MAGALRNPITRLPFDVSPPQDVLIDIKPMTWEHVNVWHSVVQPIVNAKYQHFSPVVDERNVRADVGWDWSFNYTLALLHNTALLLPLNASGSAKAMSVVITSEHGEEIPVGMLTVVPNFQCNVNTIAGKRSFAWFLADAPKEFYTNLLGIPAIKGVAKTLVDSAVQSGLDLGGAGNTLLHADPNGGTKLHDFYVVSCGMTQVAVQNGPISITRRKHTNQYYHMDAAAAFSFAHKSDHRR